MNHDHLPICVCDCDHQDIKCAMRVRTLSIVRRNNEINDGQRSVEIVTGIVLLVSRTATPIYYILYSSRSTSTSYVLSCMHLDHEYLLTNDEFLVVLVLVCDQIRSLKPNNGVRTTPHGS